MVQVVYETHSTTTDNEAGVATGWRHGRLSERGRRQARELGERRRNDGIAAVFTSDLQRAVETAQIAFAGSDITVYQDPSLQRQATARMTPTFTYPCFLLTLDARMKIEAPIASISNA